MTAAVEPHFQAEWPDRFDPAKDSFLSKISRIVYNILSVIVFPIGLMRLAGNHFRNLAFRIINPGSIEIDENPQTYFQIAMCLIRFVINPEKHKADLSLSGKWLKEHHDGHSLKLTTPDKATLDGVFIPGKNTKKAILFMGGNAEQWEQQHHRAQLFKSLGVSTLMLNPRGVGESTGYRSEDGYSMDPYTAFEYLINVKNMDPEDVLVVGFSMGGAHTARGADLIQDKYPDKKIKAFNISSYSSLRAAIDSVLGKGGSLFGKIGMLAIRILGICYDVKEAWDRLKGEKCIFYRPDDQMISKKPSLFHAVSNNPKSESRVITGATQLGHIDGFTKNEELAIKTEICRMLGLSTFSSLENNPLSAKQISRVA